MGKDKIIRIATFMGWEPHPRYNDCMNNNLKNRNLPYWSEYNREIPINEMDYQHSWDWLLPVVKKLNTINNESINRDVINLNENLINMEIGIIFNYVHDIINFLNKSKLSVG